MATYYSDQYGPNVGETGHFTTRSFPVKKSDTRHRRGRTTTARITVPAGTDLGDDEVIRVLDLKSGDRVTDIRFSMDADFGATTTWNIGLYKKGAADDGAVIDEDLFASAVDWSGAIARVDYFKEAATLTDMDRGQPLWYLADKGAGTYTEDPVETWTLTLQTTQDISAVAAAVEMLCEVEYTAGD